ncbi:hypothetical protein COB55_02710 [Candidatus Wolfebacteria bacterium]|nr:MAG: hypothetical protein COB55_02710 [Candidatus Wolfebacteria bacterium]
MKLPPYSYLAVPAAIMLATLFFLPKDAVLDYEPKENVTVYEILGPYQWSDSGTTNRVVIARGDWGITVYPIEEFSAVENLLSTSGNFFIKDSNGKLHRLIPL